MIRLARAILAASLVASLAACSGSPGGGASVLGVAHDSPPTLGRTSFFGASPIKHVVIIMQENRTFDNLFNGFPGADTVTAGKTSTGAMQTLQPVTFESTYDLNNDHPAFLLEYDGGKMDGFDKVPINAPGNAPGIPPTNYAYSYVPQYETMPYWSIAKQYVLADKFFQSDAGPTFPSHQYLIAGQSGGFSSPNFPSGSIGVPWGCDAAAGTHSDPNGLPIAGGFPCYDYLTMADLLDRKNRSWKYYSGQVGITPGGNLNGYDAIRHIRYSDDWNTKYVHPETQVLVDAASPLPDVTYVVPEAYNSDHPQGSTGSGPNWVASVVNAIGTGPNWNSTAIFISWDDWAGWYDHVAPPQLDAFGLGFRVPLMVVSPYAKTGVIHTQYELGSVLKTIEEIFGLDSLGTPMDTRATDLADCFDFTQTPRAFKPIATTVAPAFFLHHAADMRQVDK